MKLKSLPTARSTDCIYLNKTDWDFFAAETGVSLEQLETWEGIYEVSKKYYERTGNPFWGMQNSINYMKLTAAEDRRKKGVSDRESNIENYYSEDAARKIWDIYYKSYMQDFFSFDVEDTGSMNAMKRGDQLMAVASTAGAVYCPQEVVPDENYSYPIECITIPYPHYQTGDKYALIRGNSFCIVNSDYTHEYAAAVFLKWFTEMEQNKEYAVSTGYLPVKNEALARENLIEGNEAGSILQSAQETSLEMLQDYTWYGDPVNEYNVYFDSTFHHAVTSTARRDKRQLKDKIQKGENPQEIMDYYTSEEYFVKWYDEFVAGLK